MIRTKPLPREERRDCKNCGRRLRRSPVKIWGHGDWIHVRPRMDCTTPDPYKTKRTPKRTSLTKSIRKVWRLLIVQNRDGEPRPCINCGTFVGVQAAHIIGVAQSKAVMFHPDNGLPLCEGPGTAGCHKRFDSYQLDRDALIERAIGAERYAGLKAASIKAERVDKNAVLATMKARLAALRAQEEKP
jgi:hypothetical protein